MKLHAIGGHESVGVDSDLQRAENEDFRRAQILRKFFDKEIGGGKDNGSKSSVNIRDSIWEAFF